MELDWDISESNGGIFMFKIFKNKFHSILLCSIFILPLPMVIYCKVLTSENGSYFPISSSESSSQFSQLLKLILSQLSCESKIHIIIMLQLPINQVYNLKHMTDSISIEIMTAGVELTLAFSFVSLGHTFPGCAFLK